MTNKKTNHQSVKTLEEAVDAFISEYDDARKSQDAESGHRRSWHTIDGMQSSVHKLRAALAAARNQAPDVPRQKYENTTKESFGREGEIEERHESFGLVQISRVQGYTRLFGSSVKHASFFRLRVMRGKRVVTNFGEHYYDDNRVPIVEVSLSAAQFVDMITAQNIGSGVPCTIVHVEGVDMDPVPEGAGNEVKVIADMYRDRIKQAAASLKKADAELRTILAQKTLNKTDRARIYDLVHTVTRLMDDTGPHAVKLIGEFTEKMASKGRTEVEAFIQLALQRAGIKAIRDTGGQLMLGSGDGETEG